MSVKKKRKIAVIDFPIIISTFNLVYIIPTYGEFFRRIPSFVWSLIYNFFVK